MSRIYNGFLAHCQYTLQYLNNRLTTFAYKLNYFIEMYADYEANIFVLIILITGF